MNNLSMSLDQQTRMTEEFKQIFPLPNELKPFGSHEAKPAVSESTAPVDARERLHRFLNAAAGEGFELDGVDAADLYIELFPEEYARVIASIDPDASIAHQAAAPAEGEKT